MAAHRYWRVRFWKSAGSPYISVSEIEFLETGTSLPLPPDSFDSSGDYNSDHSKNNAFDGIKGSGPIWASNTLNSWLSVSYNTPVDIEAAKIWNAWSSANANQSSVGGGAALEYSDDNVNWTISSTVWTGSNGLGKTIIIGEQTLPSISQKARFWKLSNLETNDTFLELSRLELWNDSERVCQNATLTTTVAPTIGDISTLKAEGSAVCTFARTYKATDAVFSDFVWDAGVGKTLEVLVVRYSGPQAKTFARYFELSYSDNGVDWTIYSPLNKYQMKFPGVHLLTKKADPVSLI